MSLRPTPVLRRGAAWTARPIGVLTLLTFAMYGVYSFSRYRQFLMAGYDLGIFDQAVRRYSEFKAPIVPLKGANYNILGDHFHPILVVLAPLYWVWSDPRTLVLAQAALIAASVPLVHRFARRRFGIRTSFAIAAGYAIGWPLESMADFDFHEIAFGVPLIIWAIDSLDDHRDRQLFIACGLLLLVREDMGILVLLIGLLRLSRRPRLPALGLVLAGIAMYALATEVLLPHFSSTSTFAYWTYDALGPNAGSAIRSIVLHPWHAIHLFFSPETKTRTILWLLAPYLFLSLRSRYALIALPLFAGRFFSSRPTLWTTQFHYSAIMWTILAAAAIDGAARLGLARWVIPRRGWALIPAILAVWGIASNEPVFHPMNRLFSLQILLYDTHMADQQAAVEEVPADTCVEADDRIAVHLTHSNAVSVPGLLGRTPDFTVLDMSQAETGYLAPTPQQALATAEARGDRVVLTRGSMLVLRSGSYAGPSKACRP
jgi:uncharacterized membrane protein